MLYDMVFREAIYPHAHSRMDPDIRVIKKWIGARLFPTSELGPKDPSKMISSYFVAFVCFIYCFLWKPLTGSPLLLLLQNSFHTTPCLSISWLWPQHLFPAFFLPGRFYFEPFLLFYFLIIPGRFYFERSTSCGGSGELYKQRAIQVGPSPSPSQYRRRDNADENQYVFKI